MTSWLKHYGLNNKLKSVHERISSIECTERQLHKQKKSSVIKDENDHYVEFVFVDCIKGEKRKNERKKRMCEDNHMRAVMRDMTSCRSWSRSGKDTCNSSIDEKSRTS